MQNINGLSDETDTSNSKQDSPSKVEKTVQKEEPSSIDSSVKVTPKTPVTKASSEHNVFDINICYDNTELIYFSVEKQDINKTGSTSDKSSVGGSVNSSTEPFALPSRSSTLTANSSGLSSSSSEAPVSTNQLDKTRQEVKGTVALCSFIIDHFEKVGTSH